MIVFLNVQAPLFQYTRVLRVYIGGGTIKEKRIPNSILYNAIKHNAK